MYNNEIKNNTKCIYALSALTPDHGMDSSRPQAAFTCEKDSEGGDNTSEGNRGR